MTTEPHAPPVDLDLARIFPSRDHAEAYVDRVFGPHRAVAILPHPEGCVIGIINPAARHDEPSIVGYEA